MERFAFKIDAALRANLHKICRLCGIDNPSKVPILLPNEDIVIDLDEPSLSQKIYDLVGVLVRKYDKMPQTICSICVDKINDFYEFREMCYATNTQTRELLGLKPLEPQKLIDLKPIVNAKGVPVPVVSTNKRGRKRKSDETAGSSSKISPEIQVDVIKKERESIATTRKKLRLQPAKTEIKEEQPENVAPTCAVETAKTFAKKTRKSACTVCGEKFETKELAEKHRGVEHVPTITRYYCNACDQTHNNNSDIKAHLLWHKLSKSPFKCPLCDVELSNNYAFSRHMRDHTVVTPLQLQVFDRECPLCKKTFVTNYFYNTHPCAIRARKCGGCNRTLGSEITYMRHAATCPKIYLTHSKHILPEAANIEDQMRIKNEVGVDDTTDALTMQPKVRMKRLSSSKGRSSADEAPDMASTYDGDDVDMQPIVLMERLASPLVREAAGPNKLGAPKSKSSERVSSKKYLKRVDQLLRSTINTLTSIKHEPEVHIHDTGPPVEQTDSDVDDEPADTCDDFHAADDDSDAEELNNATADIAAAQKEEVPNIAVKQEPIDEALGRQPLEEVASDGVYIKQEPKPFALKLKITKNHGQLNSSLVDENEETQTKSSKKKKKRKHKERNKETEMPAPVDSAQMEAEETASSNFSVNIKQERLDDGYQDTTSQSRDAESAAGSTVMTSIPMTQFEDGSYEYPRQEAEEFTQPAPGVETEPEDVKPNRLELDRMLKIAHVASGVDMGEEDMQLENSIAASSNESNVNKTTSQEATPKPKSSKLTARKSVGGIPRKKALDRKPTSDDKDARPSVSEATCMLASAAAVKPASEAAAVLLPTLPQIVAIESGAVASFEGIAGVTIKPEPCNRGYADEMQQEEEQCLHENENAHNNEMQQEDDERVDEINHNDKIDEEAAYISSLDFNNVRVKQEKDLDLSDEQFDSNELATDRYNGLPGSESHSEDDDEDSLSSGDEAEKMADAEELERATRIYREIELMPLEENNDIIEPLVAALDAAGNEVEEPPTAMSKENKVIKEQPATSPLEANTENQDIPVLVDNNDAQQQRVQETNYIEEETTPATENNSEQPPHPELQASNYMVDEKAPALEKNNDPTQEIGETSAIEKEKTPAVVENTHVEEILVPKLQENTEMKTEAMPAVEENNAIQELPEPAFGFVITSVCSGVDAPEIAANSSYTPTDEEAAISHEDTISAPKDCEAEAQPISDNTAVFPNCPPIDEEQQNVLNQLSADQLPQLSMEMEPPLIPAPQEPESSTPTSISGESQCSTSNISNINACDEALASLNGVVQNEETENRINEQHQQEQLQQQRCQDDDFNINEIAENNNNANIERELQDDANGAQENLNT
ncbi:uncharacterized protein LOC115620498 [Scaptodrosophila lebanonensis]|uniref:Uncharacterized protein LOC115620498 n=1 Tax=Drosophila lebanonensis TaxID=7225 RepID=A0A6J2T308_DROLE|nr:uncharacterized protein LOC115620498 [Scaptodrosophila lebanonensis]